MPAADKLRPASDSASVQSLCLAGGTRAPTFAARRAMENHRCGGSSRRTSASTKACTSSSAHAALAVAAPAPRVLHKASVASPTVDVPSHCPLMCRRKTSTSAAAAAPGSSVLAAAPSPSPPNSSVSYFYLNSRSYPYFPNRQNAVSMHSRNPQIHSLMIRFRRSTFSLCFFRFVFVSFTTSVQFVPKRKRS